MKLHVDVTAEPPGFNNNPQDGRREFAVHLAPVTDGLSAPDGQKAIHTFLAAAPTTRFLLITVGTPNVVTEIGPEPLSDLDKGLGLPPFDVMAWLKERAKNGGPSFWNSGEMAGQNGLEVYGDDQSATASQLLHASLNWPAPLPQRAGLVHLIRTDLVRDGVRQVIVPLLDDPAPDGSTVTVTDAMDYPEMATVIYGGHEFTTPYLKPYVSPPLFGADGWLAPDTADAEAARLLARLRPELPECLAPLPIVLDAIADAEPAVGSALSDWLGTAGPILLADQIELPLRDPNRGGRLWDALREAFAKAIAGTTVQHTAESDWLSKVSELLAGQLTTALGGGTDTDVAALAAGLEDEGRLEAALLAVLDLEFGKDWLRPLDTNVADEATRLQVGRRAREEFKAHYDSDGADARSDLRLDQADILLRAILEASKELLGLQSLNAAILQACWAKVRLGISQTTDDLPESMLKLASSLPAIDPTAAKELHDILPVIWQVLDKAHRAFVTRLASTDFVPDSAPQPLSILVTSAIDPAAVEDIMRQTTGFGVVIAARRPGVAANAVTSAAYVNAARLLSPGGKAVLVEAAIEPVTLSANFGLADISVRYDGLPLVRQQPAQPLDTSLPYATDFIETASGLRMPPRLAYGYAYDALAFFIPNSGRLPPGLRAQGSVFLPRNPDNPPIDPNPDTYLRRTRVSETALQDAGHDRRLAHVPADTVPISPELFTAAYPGAAEKTPPVLLIASPGPAWRKHFSDPARVTVTMPCVGYTDFDHWVANPALRDELAKGSGRDPADMLGIIDTVSLARAAFEAAGDAENSGRINRLPDPSVIGLRITLTVFDRLFADGETWKGTHDVPMRPWTNVTGASNTYEDLVGLLKQVERGASFTMKIETGATREVDTKGEVTFRVEEGDICLLTIQPLVDERNFDDKSPLLAFHHELKLGKDIVSSRGKPCVLMPGARILVEAMQLPDTQITHPKDKGAPHLSDDQRTALSIRTEGLDRAYRYVIVPDFAAGAPSGSQAVFRAFSEVDVVTQRWRPTGRPIYRWIDPAFGNDGPVVDLKPAAGTPEFKNTAAFEADAFHDRPTDDGERRRIRLPAFLPGNALSVEIDHVVWPSGTATYLRHSEEFRSRYLGAMARGSGIVASRAGRGISHRVAILADTGVGHVSPPPMRHVLPSLSHPGGAGAGPLPFVCTLAEPPFAQFGLADRFVAGVETIRRFDASATPLQLKSLRKEIGPEPRATRKGVDDGPSRSVTVRAEGPAGLHFEQAAVKSPGFVNSAYLLHLDGIPEELAGHQFFAALVTCRYADPGWTWMPNRAASDTLPDSWWLDLSELALKDGDKLSIVPAHLPVGDPAPVSIHRTGNVLTVEIDRASAYHKGGTKKVELCSVDPTQVRMILLHRGMDDGQKVLTVLVQPSGLTSDAKGEIQRPQFMASARYRAEGRVRFHGDHEKTGMLKARPAVFSENTARMWGQTAHDISHLAIAGKPGPISNLLARITKGELSFTDRDNKPVTVASLDSLSAEPMGRHVHLAAIQLEPSKALGAEVLVPVSGGIALLSPIGKASGVEAMKGGKVALLALETNARPLGTDGKGSVTFDLRAHRADERSAPLLLRCRLVPGAATSTADLVFTLIRNRKVSFILPGTDLGALRHIDIRIDANLASDPVVECWGTDERLPIQPHSMTSEDAPLADATVNRATSVTLNVTSDTDIAADVSMFPDLPVKDAPMWNWDWTFPPVEGERDIDVATSATAMGAQAECVAVPLSVSEPIPCRQED